MYNIRRNNIFKNLNKVCYISKKLEPKLDAYGNEINVYDKPKKYKFNYQPVTDEAEALVYGKTEQGVIKAFLDYDKYIGKIDTFDLAYLYGANPANEKSNGNNANYKVITCIPQNTKILVYFSKLTKKQGGQYEESKK